MAYKRTGKEGAMRLTTYDNICNSSILAGTGEQVCRGSNLHKDNDGWANCRLAGGVICTKIMMAGPSAGQFPLICCKQF
jgi:hypothetical protein